MLNGILGKKIGMTQVFTVKDHKVVPVTAIYIGNWFVTGAKIFERDGYNAIQVGCLRDKYRKKEFSIDWIKKLKHHFSHIKEIELLNDEAFPQVGQPINFASLIQEGGRLHLFGTTKGRGFAGVVKRHGFSGGPKSHGSCFGRIPGAMGGARMQGKVPKGKKLPGHMGGRRRMMANLEIVKILNDDQVVLVKGSVPGHSGSLVYAQKVQV